MQWTLTLDVLFERRALLSVFDDFMISFDKDGYRFHLRAGAILRKEDCVLLHQAEGDTFWALPGGRINAGEPAEEALKREMLEELDLPIKVGRLAWVVENFFSHADRVHHEVGLYFLAEPASERLSGHGPFFGREADKKLTFQWFKQDPAVLDMIEIRPGFLASVLAKPFEGFKHFVHCDGVVGFNSAMNPDQESIVDHLSRRE